MKFTVIEDTTNKLLRIFVQDSSATDGSGLTGLLYNSSGLTWYWIAEGDSSTTQATLATATVGTYTSGGFIEVDATNMPGVYEIGIPDAAIDATSEGSVAMMLQGATNMAPVTIELQLDRLGQSAPLLVDTTIATYTDAQNFTLTASSADNDAYNDLLLVITDATTATQKAAGRVSDYVGSTKAVTLDADPGIFTAQAGDRVQIFAVNNRVNLVDTTTNNTDMISAATVNAQCDTAITDAALPSLTELQTELAALGVVGSSAMTTLVNASLAAIYLDQLFAVVYDAGTKPGVEGAFLNKIIEQDGSAHRFTTNALEQAPGGGGGSGDSILLHSTTIATLASQTSFTLTTPASADDDAYNGRLVVITDATTAEQKCIGRISDYVGSTKTVTLEADPGIFTMATSDTIEILALSGATTSEISTAVGLTGLSALSSGTATAGASTTITLAASEPATANWYNKKRIVLTGGTGSGQSALISSYSAARVATIEGTWATTPDATTTYEIQAPETNIASLLGSVLTVSNVPVGEATGFPARIVQGDAYTAANGREVKMYFKDANDVTLTQFGSKIPSDSDFIWLLRFFKLPASATESAWAATMEIQGDENDWDVTDPAEPFLEIDMPTDKLDLLTIDDGKFEQKYNWQLILFWGTDVTDDDHELTASIENEVTVYRKIKAAT